MWSCTYTYGALYYWLLFVSFQNLDANYNQLNCVCLVARNGRRGEESKGERGRENDKIKIKKKTIFNFSYLVWNGIISSSLISFLIHLASFLLHLSLSFLQTTVLKFSIVIIYAPPSKVPASSSTSRTTNFLHAFELWFLKFDRDDSNGWIYRAEQYFEYHSTWSNCNGNRWFTKKKRKKTRACLLIGQCSREHYLRFWAFIIWLCLKRHYHNWSKFYCTGLPREVWTFSIQANFHCTGLSKIAGAFLTGCCIGGSVDEIRLEVKIQKPLLLLHLHCSCSTCGPRFVRISTKQLNSINIWILELKWRSVKNMAFDPKCQSSKVLTSEVKMVEAIIVWFVSLLINS